MIDEPSNVIWLNKDKQVSVKELNLPDSGSFQFVDEGTLRAYLHGWVDHPGNAKIKGNCAEIDDDCA